MTDDCCAVCGGNEIFSGGMSKVVVEGHALELCRTHAATVVAAMPETFEQLRALFVGVSLEARVERERRSPIERRDADDRRVFPPRAEGRRRAPMGRRAGDLQG